MSSVKCDHCINKTECENCDKGWHDKFIPSEEVKKYFRRGYTSVKGINGYVYDFDTTNELLVPTHHIIIGNKYYCPYCGNVMQYIQDKHSLDTIGRCCICEGARAEIEYENRKAELLQKHEDELYELKKEYNGRLAFCVDKLIEIKHEQDKRYKRECGHLSTLNGNHYTTIDQILY